MTDNIKTYLLFAAVFLLIVITGLFKVGIQPYLF